MSNEGNNNTAEAKDIPSMQDAATTPIDLASAFKALNQINGAATEESVEAGESDDTEGYGQESVGVDGSESEGSVEIESGSEYDTSSSGGSTNVIDAIDFNAYKQELLREIQSNAASQVRREFDESNIGYYSTAELTVRDENTGQIRFRNPDVQDERDPNYYFNSRAEMEQFRQAWNQGVDYEFRKAVNEKQQELLRSEAPKARLIDFLPTWQAMDDVTKDIFDTLLEGHEIRDAHGNEIGFNVDLHSVANQARRIAKNYGGGKSRQNQQQATAGKNASSNGPAMDMQTGNGKSQDEAEPKNIGEALKMLDKKNKGAKK